MTDQQKAELKPIGAMASLTEDERAALRREVLHQICPVCFPLPAESELLRALKDFMEEWDDLAMNQLAPCYEQARALVAKYGK